MNIGIIGATGKAGQLILQEAITRGHDVTAIVRNAAKVTADVTILERDVLTLTKDDLNGFDAIVNAFNAAPGEETKHIEVGRHLINVLAGSKTRLFVVGGAGSLFVDAEHTVRVMETPDFPEAYYPTASNMGKNLIELQGQQDVTWTYLSPAGFFDPSGQRTGTYTIGGEQMILNAKGESYISYADYAIAVVDELENAQHLNERFSVVGEQG
ncbi:NAD(P)-dependent oxidoreductase [Exiguobacterium sp. s191]|uniref:NAD(P)-dependent oxidoreductase n=1 Tax=Exiguobacterium sp. s191 TaxID=2751196 RepID=UPI001BE6B414|nr:NAD(P)-dependent oxidoreductase [Exiguobacterium sp. s191]